MMGRSGDPDLKLFLTPDRNDVLVTYREVRGGAGGSVSRAYFARANAAEILANRKPAFVSADTAAALQLIPLDVPASCGSKLPRAAADQGLRARLSSSGSGFTLTQGKAELEYHPLPLYEAASARWRKRAFIPFTVATDVVGTAATVAATVAVPVLAHCPFPYVKPL